jgi:hypothetical protein
MSYTKLSTAFEAGYRERGRGLFSVPPEPFQWMPESIAWVRGWNAADAEFLLMPVKTKADA